jgi:2-methylisocitrate lyase-like PEP mutase family enzyme
LSKAKRLRIALEGKKCVLAVGVYDGLSCLIADKLGFEAGVMGGYPTSATKLGRPDIGLLTMSEMVSHLQYLSDSSEMPIVADADTGYGNPLNVIRTVKEYERAGAAAILLEDQVSPKKCGHMAGKQVISAHEHVEKIKAALDARNSQDLVIIARTDARAVNSFEDALERAEMYKEAGADMTFIEAPLSFEELEAIPRKIHCPQVANMVEGGKTPFLSIDELTGLGYKLAFYTLGVQYAVAKTLQNYMSHLVTNGTSSGYEGGMMDFTEFNELVGLDEVRKTEGKYSIRTDD